MGPLLCMPRSPGLKAAVGQDLADDRAKLSKKRDALENLLTKDEVSIMWTSVPIIFC